MQIHKILQSQGFGSRRDCRALVRSGLVEVDGQVVDDPFAEFDTDNFAFTVDGEPWEYREKAYLMLYKPMAHECTRKPEFYPSIFSLLPEQLAERGVQPVGRLDQDTTGLLLLSDDGQFIHTWSSGKKKIPKRYRVELKHAHTPELIDALLTGVQLHDEPAPISAAAIEVIDELHGQIPPGQAHDRGRREPGRRPAPSERGRARPAGGARTGRLGLDDREAFHCPGQFLQRG